MSQVGGNANVPSKRRVKSNRLRNRVKHGHAADGELTLITDVEEQRKILKKKQEKLQEAEELLLKKAQDSHQNSGGGLKRLKRQQLKKELRKKPNNKEQTTEGKNQAAEEEGEEEEEDEGEEEEEEEEEVGGGSNPASPVTGRKRTRDESASSGFPSLLSEYGIQVKKSSPSSSSSSSSDAVEIAPFGPILPESQQQTILNGALWEWLLNHSKLVDLTEDEGGLGVHGLWNKFLRDWEIIPEFQRPPSTNRPANLYSYVRSIRTVSGKGLARRDVAIAREKIRKLVQAALDTYKVEHAEYERQKATAAPNAYIYNPPPPVTFGGTILSWFVKSQGLTDQHKAKKAKNTHGTEQTETTTNEAENTVSASSSSSSKIYEPEPTNLTKSLKKLQSNAKANKSQPTEKPTSQTKKPEKSTAAPTSLKLGSSNAFALLDEDE